MALSQFLWMVGSLGSRGDTVRVRKVSGFGFQSGLGISGAKSGFSQVTEQQRVAYVLRDKSGLGNSLVDQASVRVCSWC